MKIKRILAVVLTIVMLLGMAPIGAINLATKASAKDISSYSVGDTIEFGSYPQSKVTDSSTISALDSISKTWISYGYYSGTGSWSDGNMKPSDYMKYCDISYNGNKYRAVTFSSYRPYCTGYTSSNNEQQSNGYYTGNVYYFKYEPLKWRVLDPSEGFVMCNTAIDAQAYNNYILYYDNGNSTSDDDYYGNSAKTYYASDWANSSIRAWLNDDFYNTAFTSSEKSQIGTTYNENKSTYNSQYDSANTSDKIFLLSFNEVLNTKYGFSSSSSTYDSARQLKSTDYAQCQGCYKYTSTSYYGNSWWRLRSPIYSYYAASVNIDGDANYDGSVGDTSNGIVPAFKFNIKCDIHKYESTITLQPTCTIDGERKYTCSVCGDSYTEKINALGHSFGDWKVTKQPTTDSTGTETRYCSNCNATETRTIAKLPAISVDIQDNIELEYKKTDKISTTISNPKNIDYTVEYKSSNESVVKVDNDGNIIATGRGTATITCTVTDEYGKIVNDTCSVTVKFQWWQWIIWILLFGISIVFRILYSVTI